MEKFIHNIEQVTVSSFFFCTFVKLAIKIYIFAY